MLDQSRFPDDLKTNLLKEIAMMDKPNVEVLLIKFRLCQKMQGSMGRQNLTLNNVNAGKSVGGCKCIVGSLRTFTYGGVMFIETCLLLRIWRLFRRIINV